MVRNSYTIPSRIYFYPENKSYSNIISDQNNQDFTVNTAVYISGNVGILAQGFGTLMEILESYIQILLELYITCLVRLVGNYNTNIRTIQFFSGK